MILCINTACFPFGIALFDKGQLSASRYPIDGQSLSENLISQLHDLTRPFGGLRQLSGIACLKGPGRYISLRIGSTTVRTIAQIFDIPIRGFCSLTCMAMPYRFHAGLYMSILPSYASHYHVRLFGSDGMTLQPKTSLMHLDHDRLCQHLSAYKKEVSVICNSDCSFSKQFDHQPWIRFLTCDSHLQNLLACYLDIPSHHTSWRELDLVYQEH
ncbi:MAG: hypothetical protein VW378_02405 [bacterium]